ncbi:GGDEF domain-containing protein [Acinetobacter sp. ANC 5054]|uniref:GGDEF domain-containing protein n=1 Tax=Acinetobacter sp. ANC 5054 TaxID=1977877 RepID=UPI001D1787FD|nr:GGDEF domain-containing protein [Acinetobacter sp. ANC 5054]
MEGIFTPSQKSVKTQTEKMFDSMNQSPVKHTLIKAEACDIDNRERIEAALLDPIACIPARFKDAYHKFLYFNQKQYLRQVNFVAQLAFLIYFWADRYVLPDVEVLSGMIRIIAIVGAFGLNYFLFKYIKRIQLLDLILPLATCLSAVLWFEILLHSTSDNVLTYQYAAVILIVLGNLSIQVHFRPSLISSAMISCAILFGVWRLNAFNDFIIFLFVYVPILLFSIYICWNNTLNSRKNFLRALLDDWNYHTLRKLAHTDELTQISNRRQFVHAANQKIRETPKTVCTSLFIFDVDHFKSINDKFGHDIGDQVLRKIAEIAKNEMRFNDLLARFGGEEFIVLLPYTVQADALKIAERLRHKMEQHTLIINNIEIKFSVSIGVSKIIPEYPVLDYLIKHADIALYEAKRQGRNRVVHFNCMNFCGQPT